MIHFDSVCRFRCIMCGKLTAGRVPNASGGYAADKSERFPRMHRYLGEPCPGVYEFADWIDVPMTRSASAPTMGTERSGVNQA